MAELSLGEKAVFTNLKTTYCIVDNKTAKEAHIDRLIQ